MLPRPQIFLIDGYALIYRAFFAMIARPLTTSRGENTSAVWGVATFLLSVMDEYKPEFVVWVHDAGTSYRSQAYPEYKATREKLDEELQEVFDYSLERVVQLLEAFRVPLLAVEGYEADDVIATLAHRAANAGIHAVIVSGDKDFYQLISPGISLLNPGRGGAAAVQEETITTKNAMDRFGVPPERVVDYLALVGDASDNVPGVKGVGDKTARQLIQDYGDLDRILEHAAEVKSKRAREALLAYADNARLSRDLVTVRRDVPVSAAIDAFAAREADPIALRRLFTELEFHTLLDKLGGPVTPSLRERDHQIARGVDELPAIVKALRAAPRVCVKAIGSHGDPMRAELVGFSLSAGEGTSWYFPIAARPDDLGLAGDADWDTLPPVTHSAMKPIVELLQDPNVPKVGHDLKMDLLLFRRASMQFAGTYDDIKVASFLLDPGKRSHDLEVLVRERFNEELPAAAPREGNSSAQQPSLLNVTITEAATFANGRVDAIHRLREALWPSLESCGLVPLMQDVEMPLIGVLADMECHGIKLDTNLLAELASQFRQGLRELEQAIYDEAGTTFNINSTPQLRHILFEKLQLPIVKKTKTGPSTDADVLQQLAETGFTVPTLLLQYRELSKLMSTYVEALPRSVNARTGRIHTTFNQTGAATGRLSSSDPNLQNIPVRTERGGQIRRCFIPADRYCFIVADYSQIELRLLAHLSHDDAFIAAFQRGGDIHRETAAIIFEIEIGDVTAEMRARAKTINFATIYGQGPFALARQLGLTLDQAKAFIKTYFERFAGVRSYLDETIARAKEKGYVETIFGRRRYIPELRDRNFNVRSFGERTAMNSPIQGSAADLIKVAMVNVHRRLKQTVPEAGIVLQVHDELVVEAPETTADTVVQIVREEMEGAVSLSVPLVVGIGIGPNWYEAKS